MTTPSKMPLIILGGRDLKVATLPEDGRGKHVLGGYKAVELKIGEQRLIDLLVQRFRSSGHFDPIYIAGPRAVYEDIEGVQLLETDGHLAENLDVCIRSMVQLEPGRQVMFTTCDIVPELDELAAAMEDFHGHQPLDFWMTQIRVPQDLSQLGESSWKPKYYLHPTGEAETAPVLPGHVIAVDPAIIDADLIIRFFGGLYSTRNRPISARISLIAGRVLGYLFGVDFRNLFRFRWPTRAWTVTFNCLWLAYLLAKGVARQAEFEMRGRRIFLDPEHVRAHPQMASRVAILDALSLAKDIDTEEEAQEASRAFDPN